MAPNFEGSEEQRQTAEHRRVPGASESVCETVWKFTWGKGSFEVTRLPSGVDPQDFAKRRFGEEKAKGVIIQRMG